MWHIAYSSPLGCLGMRDKHGTKLMPLWKCKIADYHPGEFYYVVVAAWNRHDAFMLMKDKTNLIGAVEPELTRMKSCFGKFKEAKILVAYVEYSGQPKEPQILTRCFFWSR